MSTGVISWSQTAASNNSADSAVNWTEGQAPSTVNDSARAMMASIAKFRDDINGTIVTGGTSTAYTITTNQGMSNPPANGSMVAFKANQANGATVTLAVDGGTAKPLRYGASLDLPANFLTANAVYSATYFSATSEWLLQNIPTFGVGVNQVLTGVVEDYLGTAAPSGYVLLDGKTIGDASSGASERANADTSALYTLLWNGFSNTICPVSTGRGASASADFAAHKTIQLLDMRGRVCVGKDDMGGSAASIITNFSGTTLGQAGGEQNHALITAELASHSHGVTDTGHTHTIQTSAIAGGGGAGQVVGSGGLFPSTNTAFTGISIQNTGSGTAHNNVQPSIIVNKICKL